MRKISRRDAIEKLVGLYGAANILGAQGPPDDPLYAPVNVTDFAAIARAYGIEAFFVNDPHDADDVIARFVAHRGPALLHAACHPTENVWPMIPAGLTV